MINKPIRIARILRFLAFGAGGLALLASCSARDQAPPVDELRWASQGDTLTLDPHGSANDFTLGLLGNVYEPLVRLNDRLQLEPALATHWEMVAPTRWRFHLRQGVRFHDGSAFDADDVVFSLGRIGDEVSIIRDLVGMIARVEKVNAFTVDVVTIRPNAILPQLWTRLYMMDAGWAQAHRAQRPASAIAGAESFASRNANGTGPYRITERKEDVYTRFERFAGWWDKASPQAPNRVTMRPVGNSATRVATLLSGDTDLITPLSIQDIGRIRKRGDLQALIRPEMRVIFLGFDQFRQQGIGTEVKGNPFRDPRIRRAVSLAIDRDAIRDHLMSGQTQPVSTLIAPELFEPARTLPVTKADPALARRLVREAGYPGGFTTKLACTNDRYVNDGLLCQSLVSMLGRVGIKANLQTVPVSQYAKTIGRPAQAFGIYLLGWTPAGLDSYNILFNIMGSHDPKTGRGNTNYGAFADPRIDSLAAQVESEFDPARRDEAILAAYRIMNQETYYVPLHTQPVIWGANRRFTVPQRGDDTLFFANVRRRIKPAQP